MLWPVGQRGTPVSNVGSGDINFTEEQRRVIAAADCDLLVSAAAGSGKTAVLAERIVRLATEGEDPCPLDRILVVTFTRAAAAGMRDKIGRALSRRIAKDPGNRLLRRQELRLPHAKIMTIDAFCQYILRNNFSVIGLDPAFRICEEGEEKVLSAEAMEEVLEEAYLQAEQGEAPDLTYCMEYFSQGADDRSCEEEIRKIHRFAESMPWPEVWLKEQEKRKSGWDDYITYVTEIIRREISEGIDELEKAMEISASIGGPFMYQDTITNDIENLERFLSADDYEELYRMFTEGPELFPRLSGKKDPSVDADKRKEAKDIRDAVKDQIKKIRSRWFLLPPEEMKRAEEEADRAGRELIRLVLRYRQRLQEKKQEKNWIDFSDLEHLALRVLVEEPETLSEAERIRPTETAREYAAYFREIMIDEYQDSNYVQEMLLAAISGRGEAEGHNRFMVGDVKQSIYRFRLARPEIFMKKLHRYSREPSAEYRIDLHRNFRSRIEVISLVNDLFTRIMRRDVGGVEYDEDAMLQLGASYPDPGDPEIFRPELLLCISDREETAPDREEGAGEEEDETSDAEEAPAEELTADQQEAYMIAARIREYLREGSVTGEDGKLRRPSFRDIVILMRATSGVEEVYRDVLTAQGIPLHVESRSGYFQTWEIRLLTDLLRSLNNPLREIPFTALLRSVFGGFTDEELAQIRLKDRRPGVTFYESFLRMADGEGEDRVVRKCREFRDRFDRWRELSRRMSVRELIDVILEETQFLQVCAAMPAGSRRLANVRMFRVRAADFETAGGRGLSAFTRQIEQYRRIEVDFGEAGTLSEDADVVRLMSIHKSKGLEFPVVFVAGLSRGMNRRDERASLLTDDRLGIGMTAFDADTRLKRSTLRRSAIAEKMREESVGEELRVLYVAMTRAKEKLILTARVKQEEADRMLEAQALPPVNPPEEKEPLSWLRRINAASYAKILTEVLSDSAAPIEIRIMGAPSEKAEETGSLREEKTAEEAMTDIVNTNDIDRYLFEQILGKFDHTYAHPELTNLYVKTTVTEMKERLAASDTEGYGVHQLYQSIEEQDTVPMFLSGKTEETGASRGTLYHRVMELLDSEILLLDNISNQDYITENRNKVYEWTKKQEKLGRIRAGASEVVRPEDVLAFLGSSLGRRFIRAYQGGTLFREKQFMMGIEGRRLDPGVQSEETVLLQGVIDAGFAEENGVVLLDYKTDHVRGDGSELAQKYGIQLALYAEAVERMPGLKVKEKWIWSFTLGCAVPVTTAPRP